MIETNHHLYHLDHLQSQGDLLCSKLGTAFRRYFLWPFSFPTYTLSFLPGVCREMSVRSKNPINHARWCSSSSFNLRPGLFLLVNFILRKFDASSLTTSFLSEGLLGRAFLAFFREQALVALCLKEVEGECFRPITFVQRPWK